MFRLWFQHHQQHFEGSYSTQHSKKVYRERENEEHIGVNIDVYDTSKIDVSINMAGNEGSSKRVCKRMK